MRRLTRSALAGLTALALAGCWPQVGGNADNTSFNGGETRLTPATVAGLTEVWRNEIPEAPELPLRGPVSDGSRVYVTLGGCGIATLRLSDGGFAWGAGSDACLQGFQDYITDWTPPFVVGNTVMHGWAANIPINPRDPILMQALDAFDAATGSNVTPPAGGALTQTVRGDGGLAYRMVKVTAQPPLPPVFISWERVLRLTSPTGVGTRDVGFSGLPTLGRDAMFVYGTGPLATEPGDPATGPALRAYDVDEPRTGCSGPTAECPTWVTPLPKRRSACPSCRRTSRRCSS